uniref:Uncharacterized protein n=1 Tax=Opuntia streptacantha TaxID=393608 RepID=A0A7C8ZRB5_OPUST
MYPPGGDRHPINLVALGGDGEGSRCEEMVLKTEVRKLHSVQMRFALTREPIGLGTSFSKTSVLRLFQRLHNRIATLVRSLSRVVYNSCSPSRTECNKCDNGCDESQLLLTARSQVSFAM